MTAISRHGDNHRHLATRINLFAARQPRELDYILHSVSTGTYAIQEMAGWRNKKGKSGSVATLYRHPRWLKGLAWQQEVFRLPKQKRLSRYRDVISAVLSRFGDPRRPSAICIAVPQQLSRYGEASIVVQCKLSRPISPFHDRRGTAILAATAVAKVVQHAGPLLDRPWTAIFPISPPLTPPPPRCKVTEASLSVTIQC